MLTLFSDPRLVGSAMDGAADPEKEHLPEAAFSHEGGEPGLPVIEVAAKFHALFPGGEEAITRIEAYAPGVKAAVLQMLLQMTEERPYWSLQQQHARAGSRWQRGRDRKSTRLNSSH